MKYLGIARTENGRIVMPDAFNEGAPGRTYEAVEIGGEILLLAGPLDRQRLARVDELARQSIHDHRSSLEDLAR
ncbi:MAG TPA: hypothetical protein VM243_15120 [Phycisphaerae bacterium]|nr:hypothetical protein [Phycisphaerae bacterium]